MLELEAESLASRNHLSGDGRRRRQVGEEEEHRETIIEVAQGVDKGRIPISNDMIESISWFARLLRPRSVLFEPTRIADISTT